MKKKNRTLCPGEAAFRGEGNSRSYTHSGAAFWMQEEGRGGLLATWIILAKLFKMQPHTVVQQPSYGHGGRAGAGQNRTGNLFPVLSSPVIQCVGITHLRAVQKNDVAQHPRDTNHALGHLSNLNEASSGANSSMVGLQLFCHF